MVSPKQWRVAAIGLRVRVRELDRTRYRIVLELYFPGRVVEKIGNRNRPVDLAGSYVLKGINITVNNSIIHYACHDAAVDWQAADVQEQWQPLPPPHPNLSFDK